jgi:DNA-binding LacI/PurR family transcriptional regulator
MTDRDPTDGFAERTPTRTARRRRAVTIKDVARASGVSSATVTRALQGHPRVLDETRARVVDAARGLGYRPDHAARTLVTGTSQTIGLLLPSISDPYWSEVAEGVERQAAERDLSVLLAASHGEAQRAQEMLDVFLGKRVDGVVVTASAGAEPRLAAHGALPVVTIGWDPPVKQRELDRAVDAPTDALLKEWAAIMAPPASHVAFDDLGAGRIAAGYLAKLGHVRIAFLGGPPTLGTLLRLLGGRRVLEEVGLEFTHVALGGDTLGQGRSSARQLLSEEQRPTALVAYDDSVAVGALKAAHELGIDVPGEVSVVGFNDIAFAAFSEPALTTVRHPKGEMGARALDLLVAAMEDSSPPGERLEGSLVERESAAGSP